MTGLLLLTRVEMLAGPIIAVLITHPEGVPSILEFRAILIAEAFLSTDSRDSG
jgi:hypothetical protein